MFFKFGQHRDVNSRVIQVYINKSNSIKISVRMVSGNLTVSKRLWATPVASSWRQCVLNSERSNKLLANHIFYDYQTQQFHQRLCERNRTR